MLKEFMSCKHTVDVCIEGQWYGVSFRIGRYHKKDDRDVWRPIGQPRFHFECIEELPLFNDTLVDFPP